MTKKGADGEIQLTDAMKSLAINDMYSWTFDGKRYDIGTMKDWFQSHLELSIESELSSVLESVLKNYEIFGNRWCRFYRIQFVS